MSFKESIKNLSILGGGQIVVILLSVIFYFGFAYILGPEKYGNLAYLISIATVIPTLSRFGLGLSVITFIAKKEIELEKSANLLVFLTAVITSSILVLIDPFVALLAFSFSIFQMQIGNFLGQKKYKTVSLSTIGRSVIWIAGAFSLYFVMDIPGILLGMAIGNLAFSYNYLKSLKLKEWNFKKLKSKFNIIVQNFSVALQYTIPNQVDKLVIVPLFGFQTTGIFHFAIQFLIAIELLTLNLHRFLLAEQSSEKISKRFIYLISLTSAIIILAGIYLSPLIIENLFTEYESSILPVQLIIFGTIPLMIIAILNAKLQVLESKLLGYGVVIRIGANLALIPLLGGLMGIIGLVVANLISLILLTIFLLILYSRIRRPENLH